MKHQQIQIKKLDGKPADIKELEGFGYVESGDNSRLFDELSKIDGGTAMGAQKLKTIGEERAKNWKLVDLILNSDSSRDFKQTLRMEGFSHTPPTWDGGNYTSQELQKMAFIAQNYIAE